MTVNLMNKQGNDQAVQILQILKDRICETTLLIYPREDGYFVSSTSASTCVLCSLLVLVHVFCIHY